MAAETAAIGPEAVADFLRGVRRWRRVRARPARGRAAGGAARCRARLRNALEQIVRRLQGDYHEDEWGFDEGFAEAVYPLFEFLYDVWWRVEADGRAQRPGARARAARRQPRRLAVPVRRDDDDRGDHEAATRCRAGRGSWSSTGPSSCPFLSSFMRRVGGVPASPHNAVRLLAPDELVMVFPEGVKGTRKPFAERYRLQRFGRGGFVEIALADRRPDHPGRRRRLGGDLPEARREPGAGPRRSARRSSRSRRPSPGSGRSA